MSVMPTKITTVFAVAEIVMRRSLTVNPEIDEVGASLRDKLFGADARQAREVAHLAGQYLDFLTHRATLSRFKTGHAMSAPRQA